MTKPRCKHPFYFLNWYSLAGPNHLDQGRPYSVSSALLFWKDSLFVKTEQVAALFCFLSYFNSIGVCCYAHL